MEELPLKRKSKESLRKHLILSHGHTFEKQGLVECVKCQEKVEDISLFLHYKNSHDMLPPGYTSETFECKYCPTKLGSKSSFYSHMSLKHKDIKSKSIKCGIAKCNELFEKSDEYDRHIKEKHYCCLYCLKIPKRKYKMFESQFELEQHIKAVHEVKSPVYKCAEPDCEKDFVNSLSE